MKVELVGYPNADDLMWVKECTVGTMGKQVVHAPEIGFIRKLLKARHSPIRELNFRFVLTDVPYWVSVHLVRHHVGVNFYVQSQRNDRQCEYDRNGARQDQPITMRVSINAEALMNMANKRLCMKASEETRKLVAMMCDEVSKAFPVMEEFFVPMCIYHGNRCDEIHPCTEYGEE